MSLSRRIEEIYVPEKKIARAAKAAEIAQARLHAAIREAHAAGMPLRTIAAAARMSHETVRRIVSK